MAPAIGNHRILEKAAALLLAWGFVASYALEAPAVAAAGTEHRLAGVTRITGDSTSATWVTIPSEARLTWKYGPNPDVSIRGGGRIAGVVITQQPFEDLNRPYVMAARTSFCEKAGCTAPDPYQFVVAHSAPGGDRNFVVLQPGRYLLYLLADGAPVDVTLRLHGLSGKTKIAPETPVPMDVGVPAADTQFVAPEKKAYWFGSNGTIAADAGIVGAVMRIDSKEWQQGVTGSCLQREVRSPEPVVFSPACPGGGGARTLEGYPLAPPEEHQVNDTSIWNVSPGGDWGVGMYYLAAAEVESAAAVTFFLPYQVPPA